MLDAFVDALRVKDEADGQQVIHLFCLLVDLIILIRTRSVELLGALDVQQGLLEKDVIEELAVVVEGSDALVKLRTAGYFGLHVAAIQLLVEVRFAKVYTVAVLTGVVRERCADDCENAHFSQIF